MIWWESTATSIYLRFAADRGDPAYEMFYHSLVELVENVWCDGTIYIRIREVLPEWFNNGFNPDARTSLKKPCRVIFE
jgi:hypothetical protein